MGTCFAIGGKQGRCMLSSYTISQYISLRQGVATFVGKHLAHSCTREIRNKSNVAITLPQVRQ